MWWILWIILGCGVVFLAGAVIHFGNPCEDHEEDYMMGDDDLDRSDKS